MPLQHHWLQLIFPRCFCFSSSTHCATPELYHSKQILILPNISLLRILIVCRENIFARKYTLHFKRYIPKNAQPCIQF